MNKRLITLLLMVFTVIGLLGRPAMAHDNSPAYSEISIESNQVVMTLWLQQIYTLDVARGLPWNGDPFDDNYINTHREKMLSDVGARVIVEANGQRLTPEPTAKGVSLEEKNQQPMVRFDYVFPSAEKIESLKITDNLFVRDNPHTLTHFATIKMGGESSGFVFKETERTYQVGDVAVAVSTWTVFKQFLILGVEHILTGYDHLLFLFALLLVAKTFKDIVKIVTTFTIAHTVTLLLAALGVIELPSLLVEVAIALSICYVAIENLIKKEYNKRWMITFALGLLHGFGFAGVLGEMTLPKENMLTALLTFNLGVEVGQMAVVLLVLPILFFLRRFTWHGLFVKVGSGVILAAGLFWTVERLFLS